MVMSLGHAVDEVCGRHWGLLVRWLRGLVGLVVADGMPQIRSQESARAKATDWESRFFFFSGIQDSNGLFTHGTITWGALDKLGPHLQCASRLRR